MKKKKQVYTFPVLIERDEDGVFIGTVPALRGCHTYGKTLPELYERLEEVVALCIEVERDLKKGKGRVFQNQFLGVQNLQFSV